jgi:S1-C subfamily serine protease
MLLEGLSAEERKKAGLPEVGMALRVAYLPEGGPPHGTARRAGFRAGDVVVSFDGRTDLLRETDLLAHALTHRKAGEQVAVTVLRGGGKVNLTLPMQD